MIKFHTISQIEKHDYAFENATTTADALNGEFGAVTTGAFAPAATASKAIMQIEVGDDAGLDSYKIPAGTKVRVVDLAKFNGETVEIYGAQLPATYVVGNKLQSTATGVLAVVATPTAPYFTITKVIVACGKKVGVEATVVTA